MSVYHPEKGTLKILNFATFAIFDHFAKVCTREKFQNCKIAIKYLPSLRSKHDIDNHMSHISTYSNEIRVSVTYLITITLINNRKIDIQ